MRPATPGSMAAPQLPRRRRSVRPSSDRRSDQPAILIERPRLVVVVHDAQRRSAIARLRPGAASRSSRSRRSCAPGLARAIRRIVWRAPWSALRRHRTGVDDDEVGVVRRRRDARRRAQLLLEPERVRLVHAAPERHDRVLHRLSFDSTADQAFRPMSRRYCMPSNENLQHACVRARDRLCEVPPRPTTVSTRPPAVTSGRRAAPSPRGRPNAGFARPRRCRDRPAGLDDSG